MSITKSSTFTESSLAFFPVQKCVKNLLVTLRTSYILTVAVFQSWNLHYQKNTLNNYPSLMKTLLLLHCTHHTFAVVLSRFLYLAFQAMMSESVLNIYQQVLLKRAKIYHLHHCFHLLLIHTSESITAPSSGRGLLWFGRGLLVVCFGTAPVSICVVFVQPHRYLFTILECSE